jgi:hypothetical protein
MQRNYRHTKDVLKHSAVYKKRKKAKIVKLIIIAILFLCILIGLVFIVRLSVFSISEIQIKGLQSANTQEVIDQVESDVGGSYALVLPRKNIFFYPKEKIKQNLLNKFHTFADVQIKTVDTNKLELSIIEKNAVAVSCQNEESIISGSFSNCYFIDAIARAFQPVTGEPDQSLNRYVDANVNTGSSTLSGEVMEEIQKVKVNLAERNLIAGFVKIVDVRTAEFQILNNGKIIISLPVGDDFVSILNTALNTKALANGVLFDYVDARFGNKVFFKLHDGSSKSGELSLSIGTSSSSSSGTSSRDNSSASSSKKVLPEKNSTSSVTSAPKTLNANLVSKSKTTTGKKATTSREQVKKKITQ